MNSIKNYIKIFLRNLKHFFYLYKNGEIPKVSIYNSKYLIIDTKDYFQGNIDKDKEYLLLSSDYKRIFKSRLIEFDKIFSNFEKFNIIYFDHKDRDIYMKRNWKDHPIFDIYSKLKIQQAKSDVFRYCFVYQNGGYWLDFKSSIYFKIGEIKNLKEKVVLLCSSEEINKNNIPISNEKKLFLTHNKVLNNWFFGAEKNSIFIKSFIEEIINVSHEFRGINFTSPKDAIIRFTGPYKLTEFFYKYINLNNRNKEEFKILNESDYKVEFVSDFGRNFTIFDNVFKFHYSRLKNKTIFKS